MTCLLACSQGARALIDFKYIYKDQVNKQTSTKLALPVYQQPVALSQSDMSPTDSDLFLLRSVLAVLLELFATGPPSSSSQSRGSSPALALGAPTSPFRHRTGPPLLIASRSLSTYCSASESELPFVAAADAGDVGDRALLLRTSHFMRSRLENLPT